MKKLRMDRVRAVALLHGHWSRRHIRDFLRWPKPAHLVTSSSRGHTTDAEIRAGLALALKRKGKR